MGEPTPGRLRALSLSTEPRLRSSSPSARSAAPKGSRPSRLNGESEGVRPRVGRPPVRRRSEDRQADHRRVVAVLAGDGDELARVLDLVDEGVQPLQKIGVAAADADAEMRGAQRKLLLVLLAPGAFSKVDLAIVAAAHGVDL